MRTNRPKNNQSVRLKYELDLGDAVRQIAPRLQHGEKASHFAGRRIQHGLTVNRIALWLSSFHPGFNRAKWLEYVETRSVTETGGE